MIPLSVLLFGSLLQAFPDLSSSSVLMCGVLSVLPVFVFSHFFVITFRHRYSSTAFKLAQWPLIVLSHNIPLCPKGILPTDQYKKKQMHVKQLTGQEHHHV